MSYTAGDIRPGWVGVKGRYFGGHTVTEVCTKSDRHIEVHVTPYMSPMIYNSPSEVVGFFSPPPVPEETPVFKTPDQIRPGDKARFTSFNTLWEVTEVCSTTTGWKMQAKVLPYGGPISMTQYIDEVPVDQAQFNTPVPEPEPEFLLYKDVRVGDYHVNSGAVAEEVCLRGDGIRVYFTGRWGRDYYSGWDNDLSKFVRGSRPAPPTPTTRTVKATDIKLGDKIKGKEVKYIGTEKSIFYSDKSFYEFYSKRPSDSGAVLLYSGQWNYEIEVDI
jgi:hypothetical protein